MANTAANKQKDSNVTNRYRYADFKHPRYWLTWLAIIGLYAMAWLPIPLRKWLAQGLSGLLMKVAKSRRKVAETNIRLCFPELSHAEQQVMLRKTFYAATLSFFETAHAWCRPADSIPIHVEGEEHLAAALATGKGVILLSGHFGPLDIGGAVLNRVVPYAAVFRRHDNLLLDYFMTRKRERYVKQMIARKDIKGLLRTLKEGACVWYAPDQDYGRKPSIFVPFFGVETATITMTSKLAIGGDAIVLPGSSYRMADDYSIGIKFEAPLAIPSGDERADAIMVNNWLESRIRKHPEQYLWLHKRFKTRPEGEPSLYK